MTWRPWLGAVPGAEGTHFRVWAPKADSLSVNVLGGPRAPLRRDSEGYFTGRVDGVRAGARYFYRFSDGRERPDPASLLQPEGVHGPSEVVHLAEIAPRSPRARVPPETVIFCEIHLGTYTAEGTAAAAIDVALPQVHSDFVDNALRWDARTVAGIDGLRLDSVHAIYNDSSKRILQGIAGAVHTEGGLVVAESDLNGVKLIEQDGLH